MSDDTGVATNRAGTKFHTGIDPSFSAQVFAPGKRDRVFVHTGPKGTAMVRLRVVSGDIDTKAKLLIAAVGARIAEAVAFYGGGDTDDLLQLASIRRELDHAAGAGWPVAITGFARMGFEAG